MISVVEGAVGAGKTYYCVKMIAEHLRSGGVVATNLVLDWKNLRSLTGRRISPLQFLTISAEADPRSIPRGDLRGHGKRKVLVVLDEALNWFPSSASAKEDTKKSTWGEWLRQSDKLGQQVVFVAQRFDRAAKWLRELAQLCYSVRNLGQLKFLGISFGKLFALRRISLCVKYDLTLQQKVGVDWYILRPEVWNCYDTSVLYGFEASSNAYDNSIGVWPKHPFPRSIVIVLSAWCAWGFLRFLWVNLV